MQDRLSAKSRQLLKTLNVIKQRLLFFFRAFERLATYSGGLVQFQVRGFGTLIDRTNLSLQ